MFGYGYGGLEFFLIPLALIGLVVLGIVALAGTRGEPDPDGHRARTMHLGLVTFVALFALVPGVVSAGASGPERQAGLVQLLTWGAAGGAAAAVYVTHWRRIRPLPVPAPPAAAD